MEIKNRILETAEKLFFKCGVRSVTMDDIAGELGISKKTIYQNFADKDTVVYEGAIRSFDCDKIDFEDIYKQAKDPIDEIFITTDYMRKSLAEIHPSLLHDFKKYHPKAWKVFQEHKKTFVKGTIVRNLNEGIQQGFYRNDIDVEFLAQVRIQIIELLFDNDAFPPNKFNILDIQLKFIDLFLRGIVTEKGLQFYEKYKILNY